MSKDSTNVPRETQGKTSFFQSIINVAKETVSQRRAIFHRVSSLPQNRLVCILLYDVRNRKGLLLLFYPSKLREYSPFWKTWSGHDLGCCAEPYINIINYFK